MAAIVELVNLNQLLELLFLLLHIAIIYPRQSGDQLAKVQEEMFLSRLSAFEIRFASNI